MSILRAASISYGGFSTGAGYQLHGPYSIDKDFGTLTITYMVVVTASTSVGFQSACEALEIAYAKRDQDFSIVFPGGSWAYTFGSNMLNSHCSVAKGGDRETDTGRSRAYSVTITCQLPSTDENGMFAIQSSVGYDPARLRTITMTGEVRGQAGTSAYAQYESIISTWDTDIQTIVDASAVWELQGEERSFDRTNHILSFSRTFQELIDQDAPGQDNNPDIVQQRVIFTRISAYPGDSDPDVKRPERFIAEYSCYLDKEQKFGLDQLAQVYEDDVFPWMKDRFTAEWSPQSFAVIEHSRQLHPTMNQISGRAIILAYVEGTDVVEATRTETYRDNRTIDYTPIWDEGELSAYADQQFLVRLREVTETKTRLGSHDAEPPLTPGRVNASGWNVLGGANSAQPIHIGEPPDQVELTILMTQKVERYTEAPDGSGTTVPSAPPPDFGGRTEEELDEAVRRQTGYTIPGARLGTR